MIQADQTLATLVRYVGYLDNEHGRPNPADAPTPFDPAANTILISTGESYTPHDTGVIRFENRTEGPVTIDRGLRVTTAGGVGDCPAIPCVLQLWDSVLPITLAPGQNLVLAETVNFNFDTSDFGLALDPVVSGQCERQSIYVYRHCRVLLGRERRALIMSTGGLMDRPQFLGCHVRCIHWALGKGAKAAVRVEVDLLWTAVLEQSFNFTHDEVHGLDLG